MEARQYSSLDRLLGHFCDALQTSLAPTRSSARKSPADDVDETELDAGERDLAGRLMRINHSGEVCAQALYQGQAVTAKLHEVRNKMEQAAQEEVDHLAWTEERLRQLDTHTSYLNPFWYTGSFAIGALAGLIGDKWSLGFVAETERQVVRHLDGHLERLPQHDRKSRAILEQMRTDELQHATTALKAGGAELPSPVRSIMQFMSRVMTTTAYWV